MCAGVSEDREVHRPLNSMQVVISTGGNTYPWEPPYSPGVLYPEYPFGSDGLSKEANLAYESVREALRMLGLDAARYGEPRWNPLAEAVHPGDTVILKPNFIREVRETQTGHGDCLITHGSIIRAALDYVFIALGGRGRIVIADAPQNDADFDAIRRMAGLDEIQAFYRDHAGFDVEVYDLRPEKARKVNGVIVGHDSLPGDPAGYVKVALDRHSMFAEIPHLCHLLYGSEYDTKELHSHHHGNIHEYLVSRTILDADCVINLPKLKTHKKTGITVCLKNLVGINGNKNWLPHHRLGTPAQGGDQFSNNGMRGRIERRVMAGFRRVFPRLGPVQKAVAGPVKTLGRCVFGDTNTDTIRSGNWHGNDTTWRMVIDLNRILMYAGRNGQLHDAPVRRTISIVDGIIGGEGNGPLDATPKKAGVVVAGMNPAAVDLICARLMGFDPKRLPMVREAFRAHPLPLVACGSQEVSVRMTGAGCEQESAAFDKESLGFRPHFGWQGHVECHKAGVSPGSTAQDPMRHGVINTRHDNGL